MGTAQPTIVTKPELKTASDLAAHGGILTVDLDALLSNYRQIEAAAPGREVAGVVKAKAYGLGLEPVARTLAAAGCRTYFVAEASEGAALRAILPEATIYVLNGLFPGAGDTYAAHDLRPCLSSLAEVEEWRNAAQRLDRRLSAALHFDTGINRLGLLGADADRILTEDALLAGIDVTLVMSHLACADEENHPLNRRQLKRFQAIREVFPLVPASLANSAGLYLGEDYRFDLVRPGVGLYGGNPFTGKDNPFRPVVRLEGRVLQIREIAEGETAGYGAAFEARRPTRLAIVSMGYGDGYFRSLGGATETPNRPVGRVYAAGRYAPVAGRISMDLMTVDVSELPESALRRGDLVELIGPHVSLEEVAARAGTLPYEVLTSLGDRYKRLYTGGASA